jgi:hypothetical protein
VTANAARMWMPPELHQRSEDGLLRDALADCNASLKIHTNYGDATLPEAWCICA